ncbi:MAG: SCO family protein [Bacteroidota bacterium]
MAEQKASAGRFKGLLIAFLLFGPAFLLVFISTRGCEHKFKVLDDMGKMPAYTFEGVNGKTYTHKDFKNKIVLFTTIQLTCPDSCAVSFWHLDQLIYQHIRKNQKKLGHAQIVSFVTDGKGQPVKDLHDMDAVLKDQVEGYDPKVWILASGDAQQVYNIERNGENLLKEGDEYFGGKAFQELLLLVDKKNHLRMVLKGNTEGMIRRMKEHMALLDKQYDKEKAKKSK